MLSHRGKNANKKSLTAVILLSVNLCLTVGIIMYLCLFANVKSGVNPDSDGFLSFDESERVKYTLYIGTNDKDTYEQIIPTDEAVEIVNAIIAKHAGGYTFNNAVGGWVDELDIWTHENTLVYTLSWIDEETVGVIMDEVLAALNQNSILLERNYVSSVFYNGKGFDE